MVRHGIALKSVLGIPVIVMSMALAFLSASAAYAATATHMGSAPAVAQFSLRPVTFDPASPATSSYFVLNVAPGATLTETFRVTNTGPVRGTALLYPVDGTTGQTSGAVYEGGSAPRQDVGAWLSLSTDRVTIDPAHSQDVDFTLHVPANARPGQHLGGIVARDVSAQSAADAGSVRVTIRDVTIMAVEVNLPGTPVYALQLRGVHYSVIDARPAVVLDLANAGTMFIKPVGTLVITGHNGNVVDTVPLHMDTFVPATRISYPVALTVPVLAPGSYHAAIDLRYGSGQDLHGMATFVVNAGAVSQSGEATAGSAAVTASASGGDRPVWKDLVAAVLLGLGLIIALLGLALFLRRRRPASHRVRMPARLDNRMTARRTHPHNSARV